MNLAQSFTWIRYRAVDAARPTPWTSLDTWLTSSEQAALAELHASARRTQWLWGRWLAKQLVAQAVGVEQLSEIEIITRNDEQMGIAPQVRVTDRPTNLALSISHTATGVLVGLSSDERMSIGVDLVGDVPDSAQFRSLWFTAAEQQWLAENPAYRTSLLWGLKEALFKACRSNQPWVPTRIEIQPASENRFNANFFGDQLDELEMRVQNVSSGLAVAVLIPRCHVLPAISWTISKKSTVRRQSAASVPSSTSESATACALELPAMGRR